MHYVPFPLQGVAGAFLLAFPAIFSIVNPLAGALIFAQVLGARSVKEQRWLAGKVALYAGIVLLASLWAGSYVLNFFGITLGALRVGGGLVVASQAWHLLNQTDAEQARKQAQAQPARLSTSAAFYPLTIPLTTGPGTISVMIALAAERPAPGSGLFAFMAGMSAASVLIALMIWVSYRYCDVVTRLVGENGARVLTRLVAFLLLCIGTQIVVTGVEDLMVEFLAAQHLTQGR